MALSLHACTVKIILFYNGRFTNSPVSRRLLGGKGEEHLMKHRARSCDKMEPKGVNLLLQLHKQLLTIPKYKSHYFYIQQLEGKKHSILV